MISRSAPQRFDFDAWASLARDDPEAFEARRRGLIDQLIERAQPRQRRRLLGLQFRIDMERRRSRTPMAACVRIQELMWESFAGPDGLCDRVLGLRGHAPGRPVGGKRPTASVIAFPGPRGDN